MKRNFRYVGLSLALLLGACSHTSKPASMGTYGYDTAFFKQHNVDFLELVSPDGRSRVLVVPAYQGRVMTSTADGMSGNSFGWINYDFIDKGVKSPQFNVFGGEERFWLGPEGGPYSIYFKPGQSQLYENWKVPAVIDTETFEVAEQSVDRVRFTREATLSNAAGTEFEVGIERTISLLTRDSVASWLGIPIPERLKLIAYQSENALTNRGEKPWNKQGGLLSIWMLSMFNPSPTTTVFIPYNTSAEGAVVNDDYFGKVPTDRLVVEDGMIYFKIDGKYRSKIGLPAQRASPLCGSYDSKQQLLTLLWCSLPTQTESYVNSKWGEQKDPYNGDAINAYNDGPVEDGSIMGPFYEIETSSPGAALEPHQTLRHTQRILHLQGDPQALGEIVRSLFGVELERIAARFR